jgi:hypothetical protein
MRTSQGGSGRYIRRILLHWIKKLFTRLADTLMVPVEWCLAVTDWADNELRRGDLKE